MYYACTLTLGAENRHALAAAIDAAAMQLRVGSADGGDPAANALELLDVEAAESAAAEALGSVARAMGYSEYSQKYSKGTHRGTQEFSE